MAANWIPGDFIGAVCPQGMLLAEGISRGCALEAWEALRCGAALEDVAECVTAARAASSDVRYAISSWDGTTLRVLVSAGFAARVQAGGEEVLISPDAPGEPVHAFTDVHLWEISDSWYAQVGSDQSPWPIVEGIVHAEALRARLPLEVATPFGGVAALGALQAEPVAGEDAAVAGEPAPGLAVAAGAGPGEPAPVEEAAEAAPLVAATVEAGADLAGPAEVSPAEAAPVVAAPVVAGPVEAAGPEAAEPESAAADPGETESVEPKSVEPESMEAGLVVEVAPVVAAPAWPGMDSPSAPTPQAADTPSPPAQQVSWPAPAGLPQPAPEGLRQPAPPAAEPTAAPVTAPVAKQPAPPAVETPLPAMQPAPAAEPAPVEPEPEPAAAPFAPVVAEVSPFAPEAEAGFGATRGPNDSVFAPVTPVEGAKVTPAPTPSLQLPVVLPARSTPAAYAPTTARVTPAPAAQAASASVPVFSSAGGGQAAAGAGAVGQPVRAQAAPGKQVGMEEYPPNPFVAIFGAAPPGN
ncbi:hypothetical protein ABYF34_04030 [Buchananella felis]|uniref:hypothetical protein n=1 Tax=Buchananella felis TaxID=3231492 RepID=UPI003527B94B